ncbi:MAG: SUMF1/EgtB/PvdO family nonheme iron enzyme [Acidobacteria bacterium]|nr:SUMF1/EgtB/PvdO family nonheme iron enzyme [Acidobacteriota bacterium]
MLLNNRYEVLKELSQGAFGKTFLAEDRNSPSRRKCVVKQLRPDGKCDFQLARERFEREAAVLEHLAEESRQIPNLYAYVVEGGQFYLVQEFVDGPTLAQLVERQGRLSEPVVREIIIKLLDVVEYIHSQNIIHRDIKPDNIILRTRDNLPVLLDFGTVKEVTRLDSVGNPTGSMIGGTSGFMPLEQAAGRPMFVSDIFALGVTAIALLTGKNPGKMTDPRTGNLNWETHAGNISHELVEILNRSTKQLPQDRYLGAKEMQWALNSLIVPVVRPVTAHTVPAKSLPEPTAPATPLVSLTTKTLPPPVLTPMVASKPMKEPSPSKPVTTHILPKPIAAAPVSSPLSPTIAIPPLTPKVAVEPIKKPPRQELAALPQLIKNNLGMEFVLIPAGEFQMGAKQFAPEKPVHKVKISQPFYLGKYQVTQAQWQAVMGSNPSYFKGENLPVETVSWDDCQDFIKKLNGKGEGAYRLPTEAEWEYACRAGTTGDFGGTGKMKEMGWYSENAGGKTHPVGKKKPNEFGVYDMHGNVWEWCEDWYGLYPSGNVTDPKGPDRGSRRVNRGGGWRGTAVGCRSAARGVILPGYRASYLGFRLVRIADR